MSELETELLDLKNSIIDIHNIITGLKSTDPHNYYLGSDALDTLIDTLNERYKTYHISFSPYKITPTEFKFYLVDNFYIYASEKSLTEFSTLYFTEVEEADSITEITEPINFIIWEPLSENDLDHPHQVVHTSPQIGDVMWRNKQYMLAHSLFDVLNKHLKTFHDLEFIFLGTND